MTFQDKIKQSEEIESRIVYWGGKDNTIIPTMATKAEVDRAKQLNKIEEDLVGLKEKALTLGKNDVKERDRILKKTIALKNEKRQLQKEERAHQAHMMKTEMELTGLKSKVLDLNEKIGTVQRKGIKERIVDGKLEKTKGQLVIKLSREYFLQGLHLNNMFNVQKNVAVILEHINKLVESADGWAKKSKKLDDMEEDHFKTIAHLKESDKKKDKEAFEANRAGFDSLKIALEIVKDGYTGIGEIQAENLSKTIELSKMYQNMGKGGFRDMTGEMETQLERAKAQAKYTLTVQIPALKAELKIMMSKLKLLDKGGALYEMMVEDMAELEKSSERLEANAESMVDNAEKNVKHAKLMARIQGNVAASTALIVGPFEKIQSILESNPLGKWVSTLTGLDMHMKSFADTVGKEMTAAFTPPTVSAGIDKLGRKYFTDLETGRRISEETYESQQKNNQTMEESLANIQEKALKAIDAIKTSFAQFSAMLGGMLGPILIGLAAIMLIVSAIKKLYGGTLELRKEMGLTFGHAAELQKSINMTATQFSFLGVEASDVESIVGGIQDSMGGVGEATHELLVSMARLNADFGIAGGSAATLVTQMKAVGAASDQAAISQLESVGYLAQASGVAPAAIMDSVAESSEAFAGFAKDGGKNMFKAAIAAKKLGVEFSSIVDAAEGLLEFESSIEASMEASMLLGRNINTDLARQMAFTGDIEGMQREILKQAGSQADFEKMNVLQRKALAKAFGLSVSEMSSMITNQEKLNNMTAGEKRTRDQINEMLEYAGEIWAQILSITTKLYPVILGIGVALAIAFLPLTLWAGIIATAVYWISKLVDEIEGSEYVIGGIVGLFALWKLHTMQIGIFSGKGVITTMKQWFAEKGITKEKIKQQALGKDKDKKSGGFIDKIKKKFAGGDKTKAVKKPKLSKKEATIPDTKTVPKKGIGDKLKDLAKGLKAMAGGKVLQGALNLIPTGLGFLLLLPGLPGILILGKAKLSKIGTNLIQLGFGLKGMAGKKVAMGALNLVAASVAFALAIASIPFLGFIAMVGTTAAAGLVALGGGLETLGAAAATGLPFIAVGLIALLGVAMIPFGYALKLAAPFLTAIVEGFIKLTSVASQLVPLAVGIAAIGLALAAWGLGGTFIAIGILLITALSLALSLSGKAASDVASGMKDINVEMEKTIKNKKQYEGFLEGFSKTMSPLKKLGKKLGEALWSGFGMAGLIAESPSRLGERIRDGITAVMGGLLDSFGRLFDGIGKIFSGLLGFFGALWEGIKAGFQAAWDGIKAGFQAAWDGIKAGAEWALEKVKAGWTGLKETLAPAWEGLQQGASTAWEGIKSGASTAWEGIKAGWDAGSFAPVWEGLRSGASQAWAGINEGAGQAWEGLKSSATIAAEHVSNAWAGAKESVSKGWDKAKGLASKAWEGLKSIWPFARGGVVSMPGNRPQYFAQGTDTIPAMLTPGEMVLNQDQQTAVGGAMAGGGTDTTALEAKVDRLIAAIESGNIQLSTIAGNTGEFADAVTR